MGVAQPLSDAEAAPARTARRVPVGGGLAGLGLLGLAVWLVVALEWARQVEAVVSRWAISSVLDTGARLEAGSTAILIGLGGQRAFTLAIGTACSVVLVLVPFFILVAAMLMTGRATLARALPAVVVGVVALLLINAGRIVLIAHMTMNQGLDGFGWAHTVYGSAVVLVGMVLVMIGFVRFASTERRRGSADPAAPSKGANG